jgi:PAS domain S-box-containing protein
VNLNIDFLKAILSATLWASVVIAYILYRRREAAGAKYVFWLMILSINWTGAVLLQLVSKSDFSREFGIALSNTCFAISPSLLLAFVFDYFGYTKWLKKSLFILLNIFPVIAIILSIIPSTKHLLWSVTTTDPVNGIVSTSFKFLYWFWVSYLYVLYSFSVIILFRGLFKNTSVFKQQIFIFILSVTIPLFFNLPSTFHLKGFSPIDLTPIGFLIMSCIIILGIFKFRVFDLIPVAREKVIETINEAVIVTDNYSRIVMHNNAFRNYFNLGDSKLIGKYLENIFPVLSDMIELFEQSKSIEYNEFNFEDKTFDMSVKTLERKSVLAGKIIVLHDISHRKKMVEQLFLSNLHLQEQINMNELMITDLKAFSHTVAHNLKTPINNIVGFSELLVDDIQEGKANPEWANQILVAGLKASSIIDGLLLFSSISVKEVVSEPIKMDLIITEALKRNEQEILKRNIRIDKPANWPVVLGYAPWLEEVWTNLISNAIKYGGDPPELTFGFEKGENNGTVFFLQDNGNGLSKGQIDQLFIPFNNLNITSVDSHGLGLSIVKRIISKQKGTVWADSENIPGKGSRFCFSLPEK